MAIKHALMVGMMGRVADRFHEYQSARDLIGRLELARKVTNADGIEIVYPSEFKNMAGDDPHRQGERARRSPPST